MKFTQALLQIKLICSVSGCPDLRKPSDLFVFFNTPKSLECVVYNSLFVCQTIPGLDIQDRSTCPWEWFSEVGPDSPGDKHVNTCHTSATARFFCKHCRNPHGYRPVKLRGREEGERKREKAKSELSPLTSTSQLNAKFTAQTISKGIQIGQALSRLWNRKTGQDVRNADICAPKHSLCPPKAKCYSKHLLLQLLLTAVTLQLFFFKVPSLPCLFSLPKVMSYPLS